MSRLVRALVAVYVTERVSKPARRALLDGPHSQATHTTRGAKRRQKVANALKGDAVPPWIW